MRLIVDTDSEDRALYAEMQREADEHHGGRLCLEAPGSGQDARVTILAIERPDGGYGWLRGTVPGEQARALRQAAAVMAEADILGGSRRDEAIAYLTRQAQHLEHSCPACTP